MPYYRNPVSGQSEFFGDGQALPNSSNGQPWQNASGMNVPSGVPLFGGNPAPYNPAPPYTPSSSPWCAAPGSSSPAAAPYSAAALSPSACSTGRSYPYRHDSGGSRRAIKVVLVLGVLAVIGFWIFMRAYAAREAQQKERQWATVRAQQAEAQRRALADPRQRKMQHDIWLHGQAYRKWEKEHIPGVVLGPNPPEPPK